MENIDVLVVDDEAVIREGLRRILEKEGFHVETSASGQIALERMQEENFSLVITDLKMPGMSGMEVLKAIKVLQPEVPVIIITGFSTVDTAVEAMKNGAFDYIAKPFTPEQITEKVRKALDQRAVLIENIFLKKELGEHHGFDLFVGESKEIQKVYRRIIQVAPTDSTVLITGESGTGKELVARAIHNHSNRRENPFVAVDCTSLAENLLESELFGHVKGSFTGAIQTKTGLFKVADGGTLFLDEISNISLTTQAKLLRVLQEREITPIGGTQPVPIDIRLVAATNKNLRTLVPQGTFREDLFFRLNIIPIDLPPLRERKGDLPLLIAFFLKKFSEEMGREIRGLAPDAMALLEDYTFPGNVRELENIIERAVVLAEEDLIQKEDLELRLSGSEGTGVAAYVPQNVEELKETKRQIRERAVEPIEKAFVLQALKRNNWNITRAAEETGMLRPNFQALLKKLRISVRSQMNN
ncbi:two component, sigma54 specific, transcriptional regulator, Fis family [Geobacter metallireducens RCH3]|uniref:Sigma-54-dependent transcriptional response regulator n=1 Tax=Geobacter metallireducens (strain ATCC 53774 / DSM 7210 / GS-15) TaxID=269799 RepID=Q39RI2_GEOMG|nr:sigma-54 dependent transcriptional regulator [Geobacter metallireducens]ABB33142.1 sigma-54-dependent transcriptional response regulator [Geobacter metallireducens GS-15]EHP87141.1 two component, sigma54 specific, transcriptional regulator, Fis family [Geobacter metallireducens RCH3]